MKGEWNLRRGSLRHMVLENTEFIAHLRLDSRIAGYIIKVQKRERAITTLTITIVRNKNNNATGVKLN